MGIYVHMVRKRPIRVLIGNEVEDVYPLEFLARWSLWCEATDPSWDRHRWSRNSALRLDVGRCQRAFKDVRVRYVYMADSADYREVPIPYLSRVYRTEASGPPSRPIKGLVPAFALGAVGRAGEDAGRLFWADSDELGEDLGHLMEPLRIGRRKGPWEIGLDGGVHDPGLRVYSRGEGEVIRTPSQKEARP